jgi:release factor glutamine methyltransferase
MATPAPSVRDLLQRAAQTLAAQGLGTPRLDAEVLLATALATDRSALYVHLTDPVPPPAAAGFAALLARRLRREPVAYLAGAQEFWSLPFAVTPDVLIPRPETELLVEIVRALPLPPAPSLCDLGTGSGCIAVALARELPAARLWAVDVSMRALAVARRNAARHGVADRIAFIASDLCTAIAARFDAIVSNPPYVAEGAVERGEVAWEPGVARFGGADGLVVVRRLLSEAAARLRPGGWLVVEIGAGQQAAVDAAARHAGWKSVGFRTDLAGIPRALVARRPGGRR